MDTQFSSKFTTLPYHYNTIIVHLSVRESCSVHVSEFTGRHFRVSYGSFFILLLRMSIKLEYNPRTPLAISIVAVTINKRGWKEAWGRKRVLLVLNKSVRGSIPIQRRKDIRENKRVDRSNPPRRLTPVSEKRMNYATRGMSSRSRTQIIKVASSCSSYGLHISSWNCPGENYFFREHDSSIWRQLFLWLKRVDVSS